MLDFKAVFERHNTKWHFTGSMLVHGIAANDTDVVCLYDVQLSQELQAIGYSISPHEEYPNSNLSACYRKDNINIIACTDEHTYNKWLAASELLRIMQLREKYQRVTLFQYITEGGVRGSAVLPIPQVQEKQGVLDFDLPSIRS